MARPDLVDPDHLPGLDLPLCPDRRPGPDLPFDLGLRTGPDLQSGLSRLAVQSLPVVPLGQAVPPLESRCIQQ
jgi:hypothetical protein